ncbi:MAG: VWA domain-containing protein [Ruminococcus sp.]|nr:VWA domain-containing protein [Ruminococcus sp.]
MSEKYDNILAVNRWRLVLGSRSEKSLDFGGSVGEIGQYKDMEQLLDYLYSNAQGDDVRRSEGRHGGTEDSRLTAAKWITRVRELFPKSAAEVMQRHALEEFGMTELLTDKKILESMKPDMQLLKTVLQLKHLMRGEVLETARRVAKQVADELRQKLESSTRRAITGKLDRSQRSPVRSSRNIDMKKTIRHNLKNYDTEHEQLVLQDIYFGSRIKKYNKKTVIIAIDESGSMLGSVIYSAVMAQIIAGMSFADVRLVIFDTNVVDLSSETDDPAQVIMSIQLGGGTDIGKALSYCETLITVPHETCVICVTDLYEGGIRSRLLNTARGIIGSSAKLSFLTALDEESEPVFDRKLGQELADIGAFVGALTPDRLGEYIGSLFA